MKILLTGGVGFIGSHTCRALLDRGDEVTILDDFSDAPYPTALKRENASALAGPRCQILEGCVTDPHVLNAVRADAVIHLAGLAGVRPSFAEPTRYARVNVEGTMRVLEWARRMQIQRVVLASSSSVYGDSTPLPAHEDAAAIAPESPYAASKRAAELLAESTAKSMPGVAITALRFFTVYGPRQRPEMAISSFARALRSGAPIVQFGDGSMRRDFTHVHDIVRGVLAALTHAPLRYRAYNLGSGAPVTLRALIESLQNASNTVATIQRVERPLGDVEATFADITRAREELGWSPEISLDQGLRTVFEALEAARS